MPAQQSFIKWPKDTFEPASDDEFTMLSELLERAFSRNVRTVPAEFKHERHEFKLQDEPVHRKP